LILFIEVLRDSQGFAAIFIKSLQFMKPLLVFNGIGCLVDRFWLVWRRQGDGGSDSSGLARFGRGLHEILANRA